MVYSWLYLAALLSKFVTVDVGVENHAAGV